MMMQHDLYRKIFKVSSQIGQTVDSVDNKDVTYPFIYIGETIATDESTTELTESVLITIHIYGRRIERPEVARWMAQLHDELMKIRESESYFMRLTNLSTRLIPDNSDLPALVHGIMDCEFTMTRRDI